MIAAMAATYALVVGALFGALAFGWRGSGTGDWTERGVKLGMSEAEIVRSFADGAAGDWTRVGGCRGVALEWMRRTAGVPTRWARFELHEGALVAMRTHSDEVTRAPTADKRWGAVRAERPYQGGTATTIIARACETHAQEAAAIAALAP